MHTLISHNIKNDDQLFASMMVTVPWDPFRPVGSKG